MSDIKADTLKYEHNEAQSQKEKIYKLLNNFL
jgi:hypothetical protein